jgi:hypothetical protein
MSSEDGDPSTYGRGPISVRDDRERVRDSVQRYPRLLQSVSANDADVGVTLGNLDHALKAFREQPVVSMEHLRVLAVWRDLAQRPV